MKSYFDIGTMSDIISNLHSQAEKGDEDCFCHEDYICQNKTANGSDAYWHYYFMRVVE